MLFFPLFWRVEKQLWLDNPCAVSPEREKGYSLPPALSVACSHKAGSSQLKAKEMLSVARRCIFPWSHHKTLSRVAGCNKRATVWLAQCAALLHSLATHANDKCGGKGVVMSGLSLTYKIVYKHKLSVWEDKDFERGPRVWELLHYPHWQKLDSHP